MKKYLSLFIFLMISFSFTSSNKEREGYIEKKEYRVFIIQDTLRREVLLNDQVIRLSKKPFIVELHMKKTIDGVSLNASYQPFFYNTSIHRRFKDWSHISAKTMVESLFNEDKDLLLSKENICFWYYEINGNHRMDKKLTPTDTSVIATQSIAYLHDVDEENSKDYSIQKVKGPIYLVFFNYDYLEKYTHKKEDAYTIYNEIDRKKVKLLFE